jgi:hypothetical protein
MKYQWLEDTQSCEQLGNELGCVVKSITKGDIVIGHEDGFDEDGKPTQIPITRRGIEIEFDTVDTTQLEKLDRKLIGLKRQGGKDLLEALNNIEARLDKLEKPATTKP